MTFFIKLSVTCSTKSFSFGYDWQVSIKILQQHHIWKSGCQNWLCWTKQNPYFNSILLIVILSFFIKQLTFWIFADWRLARLTLNWCSVIYKPIYHNFNMCGTWLQYQKHFLSFQLSLNVWPSRTIIQECNKQRICKNFTAA